MRRDAVMATVVKKVLEKSELPPVQDTDCKQNNWRSRDLYKVQGVMEKCSLIGCANITCTPERQRK